MRAKPTLVIVVALAVVAGVGFLAYRWEVSRRPGVCQVCARDIPPQTAFRIDTAGGTIHACCPTCAMHYILHHSGSVQQAMATDFNSRQLIPAGSAYYDEGGDTQYCTARHAPVERGPEGVSMRVYDRCLPTLVAFKTLQEAQAYQQQHGGRVLSYSEALASVREQ